MPFSTEMVQAREYVLVRYEGTIEGDDFQQAHAAARILLKKHGWRRLLVDFRIVESRIGVADIFNFMTTHWHELQWISIALLCSPHLKEDGIFAETVAFNRSVRLKSFTDHKMAVAWLIESTGTWDRLVNNDATELKSE